ncbi:hypothetical protein JGH11_13525 [Dysgonomonas sp. Marseille-P4677]|uniref:hypothetical protein n=1 Tax=Dysgonomonas sp. Marseille-P4677 TaxID=2364790 RepID=UPI00191310B8|nr:hypothetical protein [Dysgonomonas sp. Marseille-P4677]MBK5721894.1 hypothetical protein [Dysgonomonas sp. Marseille-P4677]
MNKDDKNRLQGLFREIKLEDTSADFESKLMQSVHALAAKESKKKALKTIFTVIAGVVGMFGVLAGIFKVFDLSFKIKLEPINVTIPEMKFDPFIISIASVVLLLLISDTLIRKRIWEKKHKD